MAQARKTWWTEADGVGGINPGRLVFLDECGVLTNMVRLHGRSPRGTRAYASAPFGHWTRVTVLGARATEGVVGAMSVEAATSATGTVRNFVLGPYDAAEGAIVCHDANSPRSRMSCWTSS